MNHHQNKSLHFRHLQHISYQEAWDYQTKLLQETVAIKLANRKLPKAEQQQTPNYLLFCNHPPVYTLGKSGKPEHLLLNQAGLKEQEIAFFKINRGGDITYHGPGQVVGYPILDLENFFTDLHRYFRYLEEVIIRTLAEYGIVGGRIEKQTGVWIDADKPLKARKICAFGVHCSRWVTMHGWALNVNTDLRFFDYIIPCGIRDKGVTSLHKELGVKEVDIREVEEKLRRHFEAVFGTTEHREI